MGLQLREAWRVVQQARAYLLYRTGVFGCIAVGVACYLGLLLLIGRVFGAAAFWLMLLVSIWLADTLGRGGLLAEYVFSRLKACHIAVVTQIIVEGRFPSAVSPIKWARERVHVYYDGVGALNEVRQMVMRSLRTINREIVDSAEVLPFRDVEKDTKLAQRLVDASRSYVADAIMAYTFKTKNQNVYAGACEGLVLYRQAWKNVLGRSMMLTVLGYGFMVAATVVFLAPLGVLALYVKGEPTGADAGFMGDVSMNTRFVLFAIGIILGVSAKWILYDPLTHVSMALLFFEESEILTSDSAIEKELASVSEDFEALSAKASGDDGKPKRRQRRKRAAKPAKQSEPSEVE